MKIAILGAGNVGATLGKRFAEVGHEVFYGVRNPSELDEKDLGGKVGTVGEVAKQAEIILLAVPFASVEFALSESGDLTDKIIIDATNPLEFKDGGLHLTLGFDTSGGEKVAEFAKGGRVVKCFNQTGFANMAKPENSAMFVCGNDADANEIVRKLAQEIGFDAINIGDLSKSRLLEPLAALWIHLAFSTDLKRDFAFSIVRK